MSLKFLIKVIFAWTVCILFHTAICCLGLEHYGLGLGLGLDTAGLGLGLGLATDGLGLGLGLDTAGLGLDLGLGTAGLDYKSDSHETKFIWLIYKLYRTLYMSYNVISQKPINHWPLNTFLITYYLLIYLLKSNPGNPVPATGYPVPKPDPTSNQYDYSHSQGC